MTPDPASTRELARRDFIGRIAVFLAGLVAFGRPRLAVAAPQSTEPYIGDIMLVPFNFAPRGWVACNGQLLPIAQNQALFSLLGTYYGGNGTTNFALPDLRGRSPLHWGQGPGLTSRSLGEKAGEASHILALTELPSHTHLARCNSGAGTSASPVGMVPARNAASVPGCVGAANATMAAGAIASAGGSQGHENTQPVLAMNYVIAAQGQFPPH